MYIYFFLSFLILLPGLCPEWVEWDPHNKLENATTAMNLAEDHLGVAQVLILSVCLILFSPVFHNFRLNRKLLSKTTSHPLS